MLKKSKAEGLPQMNAGRLRAFSISHSNSCLQKKMIYQFPHPTKPHEKRRDEEGVILTVPFFERMCQKQKKCILRHIRRMPYINAAKWIAEIAVKAIVVIAIAVLWALIVLVLLEELI